MGKGYLIDSNVIIDFFNEKIPPAGKALLSEIEPAISVISQIEIFSKVDIAVGELTSLEQFIKVAKVLSLDNEIAYKTIELRKLYRIKLPDAVIAATAIVHSLILITRNVSDFNKIEELQIINPHNV